MNVQLIQGEHWNHSITILLQFHYSFIPYHNGKRQVTIHQKS